MLDPQLALLFALTTGVGFVMLTAGAQRRMLGWLLLRPLCPSCGRRIDGPVCRAH
jgi:hypothetical protein